MNCMSVLHTLGGAAGGEWVVGEEIPHLTSANDAEIRMGAPDARNGAPGVSLEVLF